MKKLILLLLVSFPLFSQVVKKDGTDIKDLVSVHMYMKNDTVKINYYSNKKYSEKKLIESTVDFLLFRYQAILIEEKKTKELLKTY